jgi:HSP20 family protein
MDQLQKGYYNFYPSETWTPNVNLYETAIGYLVCVDLAGVDKEKIDVEVADGRLRLRGRREVPACADATEGGSEPGRDGEQPARVRVHLMEIDHGSFAREVELPQGVDRNRISAQYRNGMLWVEIPKT